MNLYWTFLAVSNPWTISCFLTMWLTSCKGIIKFIAAIACHAQHWLAMGKLCLINITMLSLDQFHSWLLEIMSWNIDHWDAMIRNVWLINDLNRNTVFCLRNLIELIDELIKAGPIDVAVFLLNSLGPSDAMWRCRSGSTLAQVMGLLPDGMYKILLILIKPVTVNNSGTSIVTGLNLRPCLISSEGLLWNNRINIMCGIGHLLEDLHQLRLHQSLGSTGGICP